MTWAKFISGELESLPLHQSSLFEDQKIEAEIVSNNGVHKLEAFS